MAHKDFENIVKSRFQDFESTPPESLWSNINNARTQRRKWFLLLIWLLPVLAVASGGAFLYSVNASNANSKIQSVDIQEFYAQLDKQKVKEESKLDLPVIHEHSKEPKQQISYNTPASSSIVAQTEIKADSEFFDPVPKETSTLEMMSVSELVGSNNENELESRPCPAYAPSSNFRQHSVGLRLGSFANVSPSNAKWEQPPTTLLAEATNNGNASYQRILEIAPYYQIRNLSNGIGIRANLLYAASNVNAVYENNEYFGTQTSIGLGLGGSYTLVNGRFQVAAYLDVQGENIRTRFNNSNSYGWFNNQGGSQVQTNTDPISPSRYEQWVLSAEVGLRCEYILPRPQWRINASVGYRNYFWQQNVETTGNTALIEIPQLVQMQVGVSYVIRK
ncbi:MAG: hypothetical protein NXI10_13490 [bacterium]|nr:hypothetical protein [bacterium]